MKIKILDVNYDSTPSEIIASLELKTGEVFDGEPLFGSDEVPGKWKIHDFARDAPSEEQSGHKSLVVMEEVGQCSKLAIGTELLLVEYAA